MTNLKPLGSNQTQITKDDETRILYSYETPVAIFVPGRGYIKSKRFYSATTSRHINKWIGEAEDVAIISQDEFDKLV